MYSTWGNDYCFIPTQKESFTVQSLTNCSPSLISFYWLGRSFTIYTGCFSTILSTMTTRSISSRRRVSATGVLLISSTSSVCTECSTCAIFTCVALSSVFLWALLTLRVVIVFMRTSPLRTSIGQLRIVGRLKRAASRASSSQSGKRPDSSSMHCTAALISALDGCGGPGSAFIGSAGPGMKRLASSESRPFSDTTNNCRREDASFPVTMFCRRRSTEGLFSNSTGSLGIEVCCLNAGGSVCDGVSWGCICIGSRPTVIVDTCVGGVVIVVGLAEEENGVPFLSTPHRSSETRGIAVPQLRSSGRLGLVNLVAVRMKLTSSLLFSRNRVDS